MSLVAMLGATLLFGCHPAAAEDGGVLSCLRHFKCELYGACRLPCLSEPEAPAGPQPPAAAPVAASAAPGDPKDQPVVASDTRPTPARPPASRRSGAPKPVLTIGAQELEIGHLQALATVEPNQPIKILRTPFKTAVAAAPTDLVVSVRHDMPSAPGTKLFSEQVFIIAGRKIAQIRDLSGRIVSFGPEGSAGQEVARQLFKALDVRVEETPLDLANAMDGTATGDIDAVVVLSPTPFAPVNTLAASDLHLVPLPDGVALPEGMASTDIAARDYPGLRTAAGAIRAATVSASLNLSDKGAKEPSAKRLLVALAHKSVNLSKHGFNLLRADASGRGRFARMARNDTR